ncbi:MAG: zinc ribbon domain-containing protein [Terriglobia bacterium]
MDSIFDIFNSQFFRLATSLFLLFAAISWVSLIYWTYRDAYQRGALAFYWAMVVLFFNIPGWIVYLIVRPPELRDDVLERQLDIQTKQALLKDKNLQCSACLKPIEEDFLVCPHCFKKLKKSCPQCQRALRMSWTVCPYCKLSL